MKSRDGSVIRRRALRVTQQPEHPLYLFALTADEIVRLAEISRVSRDEAGKLLGYQRPEVKKHVRNIVEYLNGGNVLFPNPIIVALSSRVEFRQVRGPKVDDGLAEAGTLEIPIPQDGEVKPAWIVDGQQRVLALSKCSNRQLLVPVNGFVADDVSVQRDQFVRINSAKPLPRGLVTELLPEISDSLPPNLALRRAPSSICNLLNRLPESPFRGLIRRPSSPNSAGVVTDTALISAIQESLTSASGCLFPYRNMATGETDFNAVLHELLLYWSAVKDTFPEAWGLPPTKSRLMHGVGIRAMGRLMDRVMASVNSRSHGANKAVRNELAKVAPHCAWSSGAWKELAMRWNELQNTPNHIKMLSNYLVRLYASNRWDGR